VSISERARAPAPAQPPQFGRIVSNEDVAKALDWLRDSADDLGKAAEAASNAASLVKHTEALLFLASDEKSAEAKKSDARTQQRWLDATAEEARAAGELVKLKALREAAAHKIEAWRSEQANFRAMKL
jgi:hypothetical protein